MYDFLPNNLKQFAISEKGNLYELRLRSNCYAYANIKGNFKPVIFKGDYIVISREDIENIVYRACENSIYSFNEWIKKGYITVENGIRIGIGGDCVTDNEEIKTIKNFSSLLIRFPNEVVGCSDTAYNIIKDNNSIKNTLIISPPGVGKTTILRDLTYKISQNLKLNILVIDEKNELIISDFKPFYTIDVIRQCSKKFGFYTAIKTLSPQVIIADELTNEEDVNGAIFAINSGVKVICSVHGDSLTSLHNKKFIEKAIINKEFDKYILLEKSMDGFLTREIKEDV